MATPTLSQLTQQVNELTRIINAITEASQNIDEFDLQTPLIDTSFIPVSNAGDYQKITERQLIDKAVSEAINAASETGWGFYEDSLTTPTQTFNSTPSKLSIDKLGSQTFEGELPLDINGLGSLWDSTNNKITPVNSGDSWDIRLDLQVQNRTSNPNYALLKFDIGGLATPSIVIVERRFEVSGTTPFQVSFSTAVFSRDTFINNGCQLFIETDTGSIDVSTRNILIKRDHKAFGG